MARRIFNVTDKWLLLSVRTALIVIIKEPQEPGNGISFNDVPADLAAEVVGPGNKNFSFIQPIEQKTYVKSAKAADGYVLMVED